MCAEVLERGCRDRDFLAFRAFVFSGMRLLVRSMIVVINRGSEQMVVVRLVDDDTDLFSFDVNLLRRFRLLVDASLVAPSLLVRLSVGSNVHKQPQPAAASTGVDLWEDATHPQSSRLIDVFLSRTGSFCLRGLTLPSCLCAL
jgi:hypothetical protein